MSINCCHPNKSYCTHPITYPIGPTGPTGPSPNIRVGTFGPIELTPGINPLVIPFSSPLPSIPSVVVSLRSFPIIIQDVSIVVQFEAANEFGVIIKSNGFVPDVFINYIASTQI